MPGITLGMFCLHLGDGKPPQGNEDWSNLEDWTSLFCMPPQRWR
jgi:hypothetical protein